MNDEEPDSVASIIDWDLYLELYGTLIQDTEIKYLKRRPSDVINLFDSDL